MAIIIKLQDIDEAIENLNYKSETTLKSKLIRAIRNFYLDDSAIETIKSIDTDELVKLVWEKGEDKGLIKNKRKNFSSIKSSVNSDLKKLYEEGKNHQGIIIGHNNIFDISDEFKGKALASIIDIFREKGIDTNSKITEILATLGDILSSTIISSNPESSQAEIERLKNILGGLSEKLGLSLNSVYGQGVAGGTPDSAGNSDEGDARPAPPDKTDKDLSVSGDDGGLSDTSGTKISSPEDKGGALADITNILKDKNTDTADKLNQIATAINDMLAEAIDSAGSGLKGDEAQQLKVLFKRLAGNIESSVQGGMGIDGIDKTGDKPGLGEAQDGLGDADAGKGDNLDDGDKGAGISEDDKGKSLADITDILKDEGTDAAGNANKIVAEINQMLAETLSAAGSELSIKEAEGIKNLFNNLANKIKTSIHDGLGIDPIAANAALADQLAAAGITSESVESGEFEIIDDTQETASDELIEVVEEIVDEDLIEDVQGDSGGIETAGTKIDTGEVAAEDISVQGDQEIIEQTFNADEIVEILEEMPGNSAAQTATDGDMPQEGQEGKGTGSGASDSAGSSKGYEEYDAAALTEGALAADEIIEVVEEIPADVSTVLSGDDESVGSAGAVSSGLADYEEVIEIDSSVPDAQGAQLAGAPEAGLISADSYEDIEIVEGLDGDLNIDEPPAPKEGGESTGDLNISGNTLADDNLREKAGILSELAQAAKALEKLGPDLSSTIYSEQEIKEKAKLLSEEFDRYLSVREKFYNQHILIKGGNFLVGGSHLAKNELPEQIIKLNDFYIGKFPVTNAVFEIFVEKTGYITTAEKYGFGLVYIPQLQKIKNAASGMEQFIWNNQLQCKKVQGASWHHPAGPGSSLHLKRTHPVVQVSLEDACAFAAWTGKRIPTEKEWEAATRTPRGYLYPWGNTWKDNACNIETSLHGDTAPVDKYLVSANVSEVADTLGNVLEWTLDNIVASNSDDESEEIYIVKGASWASDNSISLTDRQPMGKNTSSNILGFRCIAI